MRFNSALACAIAAMILASSFALLLVRKRGYEAGALVIAGDQFTDRKAVPLPVEAKSAGYDGQFYYRLALNPFTHQWTEGGIRLDVPTYRQQRILMPLLAWVLSLGNARAIPVVFILINIAALGLLAWSSASIVIETGANAWWSAATWMYPGWVITMSRDCAEILEVALLVTMILALRRQRKVVGTLLAIAAVLTKETALVAVLAFAITTPWLLTAVLAHVALKLTLFRVWHAAPSLGTGHFSIPFAGLVHSFALPRPFLLLTNVEVIAIFALAILAIARVQRTPLMLAFLLYIPLIAILDQGFWIEDWSFMRATSEYWVLGGLIAGRRWGTALTVAIWAAVAGHILFVR